MATFFATRQAIQRYKKRSRMPKKMSMSEVLGAMSGKFNVRLGDIEDSISNEAPISFDGETLFFERLVSANGDAYLVKSYWTNHLSGYERSKQKIKRKLIKILNDW